MRFSEMVPLVMLTPWTVMVSMVMLLVRAVMMNKVRVISMVTVMCWASMSFMFIAVMPMVMCCSRVFCVWEVSRVVGTFLMMT